MAEGSNGGGVGGLWILMDSSKCKCAEVETRCLCLWAVGEAKCCKSGKLCFAEFTLVHVLQWRESKWY